MFQWRFLSTNPTRRVSYLMVVATSRWHGPPLQSTWFVSLEREQFRLVVGVASILPVSDPDRTLSCMAGNFVKVELGPSTSQETLWTLNSDPHLGGKLCERSWTRTLVLAGNFVKLNSDPRLGGKLCEVGNRPMTFDFDSYHFNFQMAVSWSWHHYRRRHYRNRWYVGHYR